MAQLVKNPLAINAGDSSSTPGSGRSGGEGIGYPFQYSWASRVAQRKESACNAGDMGSTPGLGRSPGEGKGCPLQYSGLENSTDSIVHGVAKSWIRLSDFHFTSARLNMLKIHHIMSLLCSQSTNGHPSYSE